MFLETRFRLLILAVCSICLCEPAIGQTPTSLGSTARKAWADYEKIARTWSFQIRREETYRENGKVLYASVDLMKVRANGRCVSIEQTLRGEQGVAAESKPRECRVVNQLYLFGARQSPGSTGWALTSVADLASFKSPGEFGRISMRDEIEAESILRPISIASMSVHRLIDHPCCRTTRLSQTPDGIEWLFTIDQSRRPDGMWKVERGRVLFDSSNRFVIKECEVDSRNGKETITSIKETMTYVSGPDGYPVLRRVTTKLETDDRANTGDGVCSYELMTQAKPLSDSEFTLTAYGIPEAARRTTTLQEMAFNQATIRPAPATTVPTPLYAWLGLVSGIFLGIGVVLFCVVRFRRTNAVGLQEKQ
jgi:hypothetical protein